LYRWLKDLFASGVRVVTQNGLYDFGWLRTEAGIKMPPAERLEEIGALATLVDENRFNYSLDALCTWRGLPGKDLTQLKQAAAACGLPKRANPQSYIWQLPARYVGPYAEDDAASTLALFENLDPILDREHTRAAYRLEIDLLPMVHEMRRRGIRIDVAAAEQARDHLLQKRDAVFAELSTKLGTAVGMAEIGRNKWLAEVFDKHKIQYLRMMTEIQICLGRSPEPRLPNSIRRSPRRSSQMSLRWPGQTAIQRASASSRPRLTSNDRKS
jgi:hypothetical protein